MSEYNNDPALVASHAALLERLDVAVNAAIVFLDGGGIAAIQAFDEWLPSATAAIAQAKELRL